MKVSQFLLQKQFPPFTIISTSSQQQQLGTQYFFQHFQNNLQIKSILFVIILDYISILIQMLKEKRNKKSKTPQKDSSGNLKPLIQEIGDLKKQLRTIKTHKNMNFNERYFRTQNKKYNDHCIAFNNQQNDGFELFQIKYQSKDKKLKMDIEINKLRKMLTAVNNKEIFDQTNTIFKLINIFNEQILNDYKENQQQFLSLKTQYQSHEEACEFQQYREKFEQILKTNKQLENQVIQLKQQVNKSKLVSNIQQEYKLILRQKQQLQKAYQQSEDIIFDLTSKLQSLNEKTKIYEKTIQKKESQLLFMEQDTNYLRIQSEKFREQKKQTEILYDEICKQYRQLKMTHEQQLLILNKQKKKLQNELSLRRNQSKQIIELQSQKNFLYKQLDQARNNFTKHNNQQYEHKNIIHDQQKLILNLESQNYKLKSENQKLERSVYYSRNQIKNLYSEVQQLHQTSTQVKKMKSPKNQDKIKALDEIHSLIMKHKSQIQRN